jgi:hypothetical protein
VYVGNMLVYLSLKKQKCMSKSPTEAELIALTDNLCLIAVLRIFGICDARKGTDPGSQDCNTVVTLVMKGGGQTRTIHL